MEGCQHNTMDVEYYGPNPQMAAGTSARCGPARRWLALPARTTSPPPVAALFEKGKAWMDANLFNGEYYEHEIRPLKGAAMSRRACGRMGAADTVRPRSIQLGAGCLVDQLVGQMMAHVCGLGLPAGPRPRPADAASILKYNLPPNLYRPLQACGPLPSATKPRC